jgi:hypothetical protein
MDYIAAMTEALTNTEFVKNYDRLCKTSLGICLRSMQVGGINWQIDLATGRVHEEIAKFDVFFYEFVWSRLPPEAFTDKPPMILTDAN